MSRAVNRIVIKAPGNRPADAWSRAKAAEMHGQGYSAGTIIGHLEAYGIGLYATQALVRELQNGGGP
jgi:hypothetical protein